MMKSFAIPCAFFVALCLFDAVSYVQCGSKCKGTDKETVTYMDDCECLVYTPCDGSAKTFCGEKCNNDGDCVGGEGFKCLDDPSYGGNNKRCQPEPCVDGACGSSLECHSTDTYNVCLKPSADRSACPCRKQADPHKCPKNGNGNGKAKGKGKEMETDMETDMGMGGDTLAAVAK